MVNGLIVYTPQSTDVQILRRDDGNVEEYEEEEDKMDARLGGDQDKV